MIVIIIVIMMIKVIILVIMIKRNNDNDDNNTITVDFPSQRPIMLSFDVTFVESKNNSRVSGDLRRHVPHVTSL